MIAASAKPKCNVLNVNYLKRNTNQLRYNIKVFSEVICRHTAYVNNNALANRNVKTYIRNSSAYNNII